MVGIDAAGRRGNSEQDRLLTKRRPGLIVGGIALSAIGTVGLGASARIGMALLFSESFCYSMEVTCESHEDTSCALGIALVIGAVRLGVGFPMFVVGVTRHPGEASAIEPVT